MKSSIKFAKPDPVVTAKLLRTYTLKGPVSPQYLNVIDVEKYI